MKKLATTLLLLVLVAQLSGPTTMASSAYVGTFTNTYPNTMGTALAACATCHTSGMALNPYGTDLAAAGSNYASIEGRDSDGDGFTNLAEIRALTNPGDASSKPAGSSGSGTSGSTGSGGGTTASYRDISQSSARSAIEALVQAGVLSGGGGYFRPNANVTRAEFAALVLRAFRLPAIQPYLAAFSDVPKNHWAWGAVETVVRAGLMGPSGDDTFSPGGVVTRADGARTVATALGHGDDVASLSDADCLSYGVNLGLYAAGTSNAGAALTRGEAAMLLVEALEARSAMTDPWAGIQDYALGPQACEGCHSDVAALTATTFHSRMVRELGPGATNANFADPNAGITPDDVLFVIGNNERNYFVGEDFNYLPAGWNLETKQWNARRVSSWLGCAPCHTTGFDADLGSFVALNITCESCHGGGAKHVATGGDPSRISASLDVDSCEPCHGGDRQVGALTSMGHYTVFEEFSSTIPYYRDSCMECHSATVRIMEEKGETPPTLADFRTGAYQDDRIGITCVVCHDPHERSHEAQLREDTQETCTQCHTAELATETFTAGKAVHHPMKEMWEGIGAIGVDPMPAAKKAECVDCHMTNGNHYFEVGTPIITLPVHGKPTDFNSCASCHNDMTAEKIEAVFAAFEEELADLNALLAQVDEHIGREQGFGRDMSAAKALRDKAYTNISFAEADGSKGIHNPAYVEAMLQAAREYLEEAMRQ